MNKKEMLILAGLAVGGIGLASMVSDSGGGAGAVVPRAGRILGSVTADAPGVIPTIYSLPAQPTVTFPEAPTFDIKSLFAPAPAPVTVSRGTAGVSAAPKKERVTPYIYMGGEVKPGAVSVAPWAMGITTPAEMGVTTALKRAGGGFMGTGMTQSEYATSTMYKSSYVSPSAQIPSKKVSTDAQKAVSHAKRLRAGRGD